MSPAGRPAGEMQFSSAQARGKQPWLSGDRRQLYPHSLQFYLEPPTENISLAEFESLAIERLKRESRPPTTPEAFGCCCHGCVCYWRARVPSLPVSKVNWLPAHAEMNLF